MRENRHPRAEGSQNDPARRWRQKERKATLIKYIWDRNRGAPEPHRGPMPREPRPREEQNPRHPRAHPDQLSADGRETTCPCGVVFRTNRKYMNMYCCGDCEATSGSGTRHTRKCESRRVRTNRGRRKHAGRYRPTKHVREMMKQQKGKGKSTPSGKDNASTDDPASSSRPGHTWTTNQNRAQQAQHRANIMREAPCTPPDSDDEYDWGSGPEHSSSSDDAWGNWTAEEHTAFGREDSGSTWD